MLLIVVLGVIFLMMLMLPHEWARNSLPYRVSEAEGRAIQVTSLLLLIVI
uniref:Uncharacterized protein n=1 Tax=CrAss-like virus sp. ctt4r3 TaxID=2823619 RepID=A0A8S5L7F2_9CAUD|nr:MAG TPA: Protein of unknown function DUF4227 [CrAss-like virus sp. ctt4r3]